MYDKNLAAKEDKTREIGSTEKNKECYSRNQTAILHEDESRRIGKEIISQYNTDEHGKIEQDEERYSKTKQKRDEYNKEHRERYNRDQTAIAYNNGRRDEDKEIEDQTRNEHNNRINRRMRG